MLLLTSASAPCACCICVLLIDMPWGTPIGKVSTGSSAPSSADASPFAHAWNGEPRVIYHDVLARVQHLKLSRSKTPYTRDATRTAPPAATSAFSGGSASSKRRRSGRGRHRRGRGDDDDDDDDDDGIRFVDVMFDPRRYDRPHPALPDVTAIDARGQERSVSQFGNEIEPLEVGSVLVFRDKATVLAAYVVGEEVHQVMARVLVLRVSRGVFEDEGMIALFILSGRFCDI